MPALLLRGTFLRFRHLAVCHDLTLLALLILAGRLRLTDQLLDALTFLFGLSTSLFCGSRLICDANPLRLDRLGFLLEGTLFLLETITLGLGRQPLLLQCDLLGFGRFLGALDCTQALGLSLLLALKSFKSLGFRVPYPASRLILALLTLLRETLHRRELLLLELGQLSCQREPLFGRFAPFCLPTVFRRFTLA